MTDADLLPIVKSRIQSLQINIVDEDLVPHDVAYTRYDSPNQQWLSAPPESIRKIVAGVETRLFPAQYTVNTTNGYVTLGSALTANDVVRVNYTFFPFPDAELTSIIGSAREQVSSLVFRAVAEPYDSCYREAIIKKCYTICIRKLQLPTIRYFSISIGGRTMGKEQQVTMCQALIDGNEKELLQDLNVLRYFNKSNPLC